MEALSPSVVAGIEDLELAARRIVEGVRAGGHRSPFHGYSSEFQQHRPYRAGDDLRHLDWKLLARTNRLYTRQFRESTSMPVVFLLDTSASMYFPVAPGSSVSGGTASSTLPTATPGSGSRGNQREPNWRGAVGSKFNTAVLATAALAYLISTQGDAVGMMTMHGGKLQWLPPRGGRPHLRTLLLQLERVQCEGTWDPGLMLTRCGELMRRRGVVIALSDFYNDEDECFRALRRLRSAGHDTTMLQVLSNEELTLPYRGNLDFADLEDGRTRILNVGEIAERYAERIQRFISGCRSRATRDGVDYALLSTGAPLPRLLREWLLRRSDATVRSEAASGAL